MTTHRATGPCALSVLDLIVPPLLLRPDPLLPRALPGHRDNRPARLAGAVGSSNWFRITAFGIQEIPSALRNALIRRNGAFRVGLIYLKGQPFLITPSALKPSILRYSSTAPSPPPPQPADADVSTLVITRAYDSLWRWALSASTGPAHASLRLDRRSIEDRRPRVRRLDHLPGPNYGTLLVTRRVMSWCLTLSSGVSRSCICCSAAEACAMHLLRASLFGSESARPHLVFPGHSRDPVHARPTPDRLPSRDRMHLMGPR